MREVGKPLAQRPQGKRHRQSEDRKGAFLRQKSIIAKFLDKFVAAASLNCNLSIEKKLDRSQKFIADEL